MASKRRKEPDAVQAVRDWLEKTQKEFSKQWPKAKKQARRGGSLVKDLVTIVGDTGSDPRFADQPHLHDLSEHYVAKDREEKDWPVKQR